MFPRWGVYVATVATLAGLCSQAQAQASRVGPTFSLPDSPHTVRNPDIAYNSRDNQYLSVSGSLYIEGHVLSPTGTVLKTFQVNQSANYAQTPRVAYSPDIAGGTGGYIVTWHESIGNFGRVRARIFKADISSATSDFDIATGAVSLATGTNFEEGAAVECATGPDKECLVAWQGNYGASNDIFFQRVALDGSMLGTNTPITFTNPDWERDPSVAYNPDANEYYIAYGGYVNAGGYGFTAGRRVKPGTGAPIGTAQTFGTAVATYVPAVTYNAGAHQYLVGWYNRTRSAAQVYGVVLNGADAAQIGDVRVLSGYYAAYDALDIDFNGPAGQYLLVTHSNSWEDAAVSLLSNGTAYDNGFLATSTAVNGNFNPRMAASTVDKQWLMVTASAFRSTASQFLASSGSGTVTPPTPTTRRTPSDFNGDGKADIAVFQASTGNWNISGMATTSWGRSGDIPVPADYNGDGTTDVAIFRPSNGQWWLKGIGTFDYGLPGDIPVPADFDGDGRADIAVFRPSSGNWYIRGNAASPIGWGSPGDIPVPADYDGDHKADIAVFRRATGAWWILGQPRIDYGSPGDIPVPADYDGDGKADIGVYRPRSNTWMIRNLVTQPFGAPGYLPMALDTDGDGKAEMIMFRRGTGTWFTLNKVTDAIVESTFGTPGDFPVAPALVAMFTVGGDTDGDRQADPAVVRRDATADISTWYARRSATAGYTAVAFGLSSDTPVPGDFDGDGRLDVAFFRPSTGFWYITRSANGFSDYISSGEMWGRPGDQPFSGDFDGDGRSDMVIYRPTTGAWYVKQSSTAYVTSDVYTWGLPGDIPVPADYDGDGRVDPAVFRPATGTWWIYFRAAGRIFTPSWGMNGDVPIAADFDGDGLADPAVYRPSQGRWYVRNSSTTGSSTIADWGQAGDTPLAGDFDGDGKADMVVFRPSDGHWYVRNGGVFDWGIDGDIPVIWHP